MALDIGDQFTFRAQGIPACHCPASATVSTSLSLIFMPPPRCRFTSAAIPPLYQSSTSTYNVVKKVSISIVSLLVGASTVVLIGYLLHFRTRLLESGDAIGTLRNHPKTNGVVRNRRVGADARRS